MTLIRHVAFLRAINVGGHNVKMDRLRMLFGELGLPEIETFIASGNVLFNAPSPKTASIASTAKLEARIESHLLNALGYEVSTFIRPLSELATIASGHPFETHEADGHALSIGFVKAPLDAAHRERIAGLANGYDEFHISGAQLYWLCHGRMSHSRLLGKVLDRAIGSPVTFRNVTTVRKLAAKALLAG